MKEQESVCDPRSVAKSIEPWPKWVRFPLIAALVGVVVYGVIASVNSGISTAALRVVVAAVVIPALLIPIQLWGVRRRRARSGNRRAFRANQDHEV